MHVTDGLQPSQVAPSNGEQTYGPSATLPVASGAHEPVEHSDPRSQRHQVLPTASVPEMQAEPPLVPTCPQHGALEGHWEFAVHGLPQALVPFALVKHTCPVAQHAEPQGTTHEVPEHTPLVQVWPEPQETGAPHTAQPFKPTAHASTELPTHMRLPAIHASVHPVTHWPFWHFWPDPHADEPLHS